MIIKSALNQKYCNKALYYEKTRPEIKSIGTSMMNNTQQGHYISIQCS